MLTRWKRADRIWWAALIGLCAVLLMPLLVVDVPPLVDYPNHLARAFVLALLPDDPVLARFYAPHWTITPNLALDLVAPPLMRVLPVHVVGRLLIGTAVLLPVLGAVAYNTALGNIEPGRRWWSLGAGLVGYSGCLLYGFLNFSLSLGVALLLAAAWLRWRESHPGRAIISAALGAPALFACHLMGLVYFGLLIGSTELYRLYEARHRAVRRILLARGLVLLLILTVPSALYAMSGLRHLGGDAGFLPLGAKLAELPTIFVNYSWPLDLATALAAVSVPGLCLIAGWGSVPGPAAYSMAPLLLAFMASPYAWKGTYALDTRFAVMLGFMLFAGFVPARWPSGFRRFVTCMLLVLFIARMALLTQVWARHRTDLADLRTAMAPVRPGQTVYVAEAGSQEAPAYWRADPGWRRLSDGTRTDGHLGALALIEHRAYWPFEFDEPSQQPIETREPYRALATRVGHLPTRNEAAIANLCGFDYVLLLDADAVPELPAWRFRLLVNAGFAALYAVTQCLGEP